MKEEETHQRGVRNTRKDLNRIMQSDTSSSDSHSQAFRVDSDEVSNLPDSHVLGAGGPTTRRAWQDWCKVSNNSNHDSHSEDEDGIYPPFFLLNTDKIEISKTKKQNIYIKKYKTMLNP